MIALPRAVVLAFVFGGLGLPHSARAEDWPCWRGPRGDGRSTENDWKSTGPRVFAAEVGLGHSECSVAGGRLVTLGFLVESSEDQVICLDAADGSLLWQHRYPAQLHALGHPGGTLTTPAFAGDVVICTEREGTVRALDVETGELVWRRDLRTEHGVEPTDYGFGGSPLCDEQHVFVNARRTFCLDLTTGATVWQSADHQAMYSTPAFFAVQGQEWIASFTKEGLWLLHREDGRDGPFVPWQKGETRVNASTPVVVGERLFFSSGYDHGCALVEYTAEGPRLVFENKRMRTRLSGCTLFAEHLYGFDESVLKCLDLEGAECWRKRGLGLGALRVAGDRLLVLTESGELVTARASAEGFEELARETAFEDGGVHWSAPVLANGRLYLRSSTGHLVCQDRR